MLVDRYKVSGNVLLHGAARRGEKEESQIVNKCYNCCRLPFMPPLRRRAKAGQPGG